MDQSELRQTYKTAIGPRLQTLQQAGVAAAVIGVVLCGAGYVMKQNVWPSWLHAYVFWFGVTAGSIGLLFLHHTVGGGWGFVLRRFFEAAGAQMWWIIIAFAPVVVGLFSGLYEWQSHPDHPLTQAKSPLLNVPTFLGISAGCLLLLYGVQYLLRKWGDVEDERTDEKLRGNLSRLGAAGMAFYVLIMTLLSVLWVMSLTPHWFSSIFGLLFVASQGLTTLALMLVLVAFLGADRPLVRGLPTGYFRDIGNLTLALIMMWGYLGFSQYLITYAGNTAEEVTFFVARGRGGWQFVAPVLVLCHFFIPFLVLLSGDQIKRSPRRLAGVAGFILAMRAVDNFWLVAPTFHTGFTVGLADVGAHLVIGGIWLAGWSAALAGRKVVPFFDPRLQAHLHEVTAHA